MIGQDCFDNSGPLDGKRPNLLKSLTQDGNEVMRRQIQRISTGFGSGQKQKAIYQARHALRFAQYFLERIGQFLLRSWPSKRVIRSGSDESEWSAEFVRGVGGELLNLLDGTLDAAKHSVDSFSKIP